MKGVLGRFRLADLGLILDPVLLGFKLFDLEADPMELNNLVDHELLPDFRREAADYWDAEAMRETVIAAYEADQENINRRLRDVMIPLRD